MRFPRRLAQLQPEGKPWCGPAALRHALLCYGEDWPLERLVKLCGTGPHGTYQKDLERGVRKCGYRLNWAVRYHHTNAQSAIMAMIHDGMPVILCVDRGPDGPWEHWITVVGATTRDVTLVDSSNPGPAVQRRSWTTLMRRLAVLDPPAGGNRFDLYPLIEAA